ncbi:hypothetical protein Scep_029889 [Stephania cephalantha]|uniref:Uncharacterized protein n=1 Tax=Stephania cephalantha TaxID=152367 RepID=A0AAP0E1V4_9MAGN
MGRKGKHTTQGAVLSDDLNGNLLSKLTKVLKFMKRYSELIRILKCSLKGEIEAGVMMVRQQRREVGDDTKINSMNNKGHYVDNYADASGLGNHIAFAFHELLVPLLYYIKNSTSERLSLRHMYVYFKSLIKKNVGGHIYSLRFFIENMRTFNRTKPICLIPLLGFEIHTQLRTIMTHESNQDQHYKDVHRNMEVNITN